MLYSTHSRGRPVGQHVPTGTGHWNRGPTVLRRRDTSRWVASRQGRLSCHAVESGLISAEEGDGDMAPLGEEERFGLLARGR